MLLAALSSRARTISAQAQNITGTILYSSHVLDVMEKVCSRVLILRSGRVLADDSIDRLRELMDQPSLEGVFSRITEEAGTRNLTDGILEAMRL